MNKQIIQLSLAIALGLPASVLAQNVFPATGNVGIGTTTPGTSLDVVGHMVTRGAKTGYGIAAPDGLAWGWYRRVDVGGDNDDLKLLRYVNGQYSEIALQVQNASGNVGIGTTSPRGKLDVNGDAYFGNGIDVTASAWIHGNLQVQGSTFFPSGNVGIGTTTPNAKLAVKGEQGPLLRLIRSNIFGHEENRLDIVSSDNPNFQGSDFTFQTHMWTGSGYETRNSFHLSPGGNVGFGTTTPQAKVHVAGNGIFDGQINCTTLVLTCTEKKKQDFRPVSYLDTLIRFDRFDCFTWAYTNSPDVRYHGPTAEGLKGAFPELGEDDEHISVVNGIGLSFSAIKGLHELVQEKDSEIAALKRELTGMKQELASVKDSVTDRLAALEKAMAKNVEQVNNTRPHPSLLPQEKESERAGLSSEATR